MARPIFSYFPQATPAASPYPIQDTLLGLGIGLLGNRNFGQGAAQGLQYANQLAGQRRAERRQDEADAREAARFGFEQQQAQQQQADREARRKGILGMFSPQPATGGTQGMFMGGLKAGPGQGSQQAGSMPMPTDGAPVLSKFFQPEELGMLQQLAQFDPDSAEQIVQQRVFTQPKDTSTDDIREYDKAVQQGFNGSFLDYQTALKKAGASNTTVNNNFPKSIGKGDETLLTEGAKGMLQAQEILPLFGIARESAKNFDKSGVFGKAGLFYERGKSFLGLPNNAQAGEVLQGMQTRLGTLLRVPGSGATSDMEMSLYMQGVPSLLNTQQGNIALANIGEKLVRRRIQNFQKMQDYINKNGSSVGYVPDDSPVLTPEDMAILQGAANSEPLPAGSPAPIPAGVDPNDPLGFRKPKNG